MELVTTKILIAVLFGFLRFFFGILPVKLFTILTHWEEEIQSNVFINRKRHEQVQCVIVLCQSFGGGVLFATCFLHMMIEVYYSVEELKETGDIVSDYPYSQLTVCLGFFLVYFVEETAHWLLTKVPDKPCGTPQNKVTPNDERNGNDEKKPEDLEETEQGKTQQQLIRCILTVSALSFHAIFEGMAIGLQKNSSHIWYLFVAVSIHSATILFCIGLELLLAKTKIRYIVVQMILLALTSPLGIIIGVLISNKTVSGQAKSIIVVVLEGLSCGTILYITFFEVLIREKERRTYRMTRAMCILLGFSLMALLRRLETY